MTGDETDDGPSPIPANGYPYPVLEYGPSDDGPVVVSVNGAFRSEFTPLTPGTPVADGLDRAGIAPETGSEDAGSRIADGADFVARLRAESNTDESTTTTERYRATVVPDSERPTGHVVFTPEPESAATERPELGIDHVASVVSHDLRNPLEVAKTRLRAGRETGEDEHFDHVARAHERMERIIEDVLTLARGEDTIDPSAEVDLTEIAEAAWESVESDGVSLTFTAPLPTAVVDPDRTGRVFENLFRNSVEHGSTRDGGQSGNGSPQAPEVRIGGLDSGTGFYVADDGPGIPPDERDAVLEPGYSTHEHGTGLGLAIVDQIADAHGWTLRITSAENGGARIEVRDL